VTFFPQNVAIFAKKKKILRKKFLQFSLCFSFIAIFQNKKKNWSDERGKYKFSLELS